MIPLDEQIRSNWDHARISEGKEILQHALAHGPTGPYQIQAAIAALHDEAARTEETDWVQIRGLYELLIRLNDGPMARLSHAIALGMVEGPEVGLAALDKLAADGQLPTSHRLDAARAHLLERAGDHAAAVRYYRQAATRTTSTPERNYLLLHAARLSEGEAHLPPVV